MSANAILIATVIGIATLAIVAMEWQRWPPSLNVLFDGLVRGRHDLSSLSQAGSYVYGVFLRAHGLCLGPLG